MGSGRRNSADTRDGNYNNLHGGLVSLVQPQSCTTAGAVPAAVTNWPQFFLLAGWGQPPSGVFNGNPLANASDSISTHRRRFWDILRHATFPLPWSIEQVLPATV